MLTYPLLVRFFLTQQFTRAVEYLAASHLRLLLVFSFLVATVFATLLRDDLRGRLRFGAVVFAAFVLSTLVAAWLMAPFPS